MKRPEATNEPRLRKMRDDGAPDSTVAFLDGQAYRPGDQVCRPETNTLWRVASDGSWVDTGVSCNPAQDRSTRPSRDE